MWYRPVRGMGPSKDHSSAGNDAVVWLAIAVPSVVAGVAALAIPSSWEPAWSIRLVLVLAVVGGAVVAVARLLTETRTSQKARDEALEHSRASEAKRLTGIVDEHIGALDQANATVKDLAELASKRVGEVEQTTLMLQQVTAALKDISENIAVLEEAAEESSASVLEMATANTAIAESMTTLTHAVSDTASSIEEMTYSIKEVAGNVQELSATAEETSSSMNEMDMSIHQVQSNANETAKLSEEVTRAADLGVDAINQTIQGIQRIKTSTTDATKVMDALGTKIGEIDKILQVIDDVAEQTNLLALNAAIIAAQAGEHGKGFAVVADEIKDLAERSTASTKEIADLIKAVQVQTKAATAAVEGGSVSVDEGVRVSNQAEDALRRIRESAEKSRLMVRDIARATVEQTRGSKQVTDAINRIAETVQSVASATTEQSKGSEAVMRSAERMREATRHVERSSQEQNRGSQQITRSIEAISDRVHQINLVHREQTEASEQLLTALESIRKAIHSESRELQSLRDRLGQVGSSAAGIRVQVSKS